MRKTRTGLAYSKLIRSLCRRSRDLLLFLCPETVLNMIHIDFETRSKADLRKTGSHRYAADPSTELMCMAYNLTGKVGDTQLWTPGSLCPPALANMINQGEPVCAHNAAFERAIWEQVCVEKLGWDYIAPEQWRCTLAGCSRQGLPRSLDTAGAVLGIDCPKDKEGHRIMMQLCKPDKNGEWVTSTDKMLGLYEYCKRDVDAEIAIYNALEPMPESELRIWQLDQEINFRGLRIDVDSATKFLEAVKDYRVNLQTELRKLTEGAVETGKQVTAMRKWLANRGVRLPDLRKATVEDAIASDIDSDSRRALEIRLQLSAASTGKLEAMILRSESDSRLRGNLVYHGASTGRWAGTGLQVQNFPRGSFSQTEVEIAREVLPYGAEGLQLMFENPIEVAKSSLRSMITAEPGHSLFVCDYASIEARDLAWICRQDDLVQDFRNGDDVYVSMAASIYNCERSEVTKDQRLVGKIAILGLGYGMGAKTFKMTCSSWGVPCKFGFARKVVQAYRAKHDKIKKFWTDINEACTYSVLHHKQISINRLTIEADDEWMRITLPSGRQLMYAEPTVEEVEAPWSKGHTGNIRWEGDEDDLFEGNVVWEESHGNLYSECKFYDTNWLQKHLHLTDSVEEMEPQMIPQLQYKSVVGQGRKWRPTRTYGGKLTENIVQAIARDFLAEAMLRVKDEYPIVATIHDEIVSEAEDHKSLEDFERLMEVVPSWGEGCPIAVEGYKAKRYRK